MKYLALSGALASTLLLSNTVFASELTHDDSFAPGKNVTLEFTSGIHTLTNSLSDQNGKQTFDINDLSDLSDVFDQIRSLDMPDQKRDRINEQLDDLYKQTTEYANNNSVGHYTISIKIDDGIQSAGVINASRQKPVVRDYTQSASPSAQVDCQSEEPTITIHYESSSHPIGQQAKKQFEINTNSQAAMAVYQIQKTVTARRILPEDQQRIDQLYDHIQQAITENEHIQFNLLKSNNQPLKVAHQRSIVPCDDTTTEEPSIEAISIDLPMTGEIVEEAPINSSDKPSNESPKEQHYRTVFSDYLDIVAQIQAGFSNQPDFIKTQESITLANQAYNYPRCHPDAKKMEMLEPYMAMQWLMEDEMGKSAYELYAQQYEEMMNYHNVYNSEQLTDLVMGDYTPEDEKKACNDIYGGTL